MKFIISKPTRLTMNIGSRQCSRIRNQLKTAGMGNQPLGSATITKKNDQGAFSMEENNHAYILQSTGKFSGMFSSCHTVDVIHSFGVIDSQFRKPSWLQIPDICSG